MKRIPLIIMLLMCVFGANSMVNIPPTELNYNVHYHWGFVNVMIAHGVVDMQTDGENFIASLDGNSIPWNGRVFCISDTLKAVMTPSPSGLSNERVTYENGWYMKPKTEAYRNINYSLQNPADYKNINGQGTLDADGETMEAVTVTADMLGLFYYFHEIDFENMNEGDQITIPFTGQDGTPGKVEVTYRGKSTYKTDEMTYPTYSVCFEYSYHGAMSGYPVLAEVAMETRIPVLLSANLPIGKVEMIYHQ